MKKTILCIIIISTAFAGIGQNLVPNGDFELFTSCPSGEGQIDSVLFWMNPAVYPIGGSPDYFNQCATSFDFGVPGNYFGSQSAHTGVAYCGIVGYGIITSPNWREYLEVALTSPLIANECYHLQMFLSLGDGSQYTSDAIGAYFTPAAITGIMNYAPLPFTPQIDINLGLNTNINSWYPVSGNFTASGGENYMIIGNYKNDSQTNSLYLPGGFIDYSYFYIDDVSLTPCTGIDEATAGSHQFVIYPNPVKEYLQINYSPDSYRDGKEKAEIKITDILGKEILRKQINLRFSPGQTGINLHSLGSGIYFIQIDDGKNMAGKKFLKE